MMTTTSPPQDLSNDPVVVGLNRLLLKHVEERVTVLGTTCTGKTTMLSYIDGALDQDREVFPKLSREETDYVNQTPWTEEIGRTMTRFVRERVEVKPGLPLFGTVVIDCDHIILLKITNDLLKTRVAKRNSHFRDAKNMQTQLEEEVRSSGIAWTEYSVG